MRRRWRPSSRVACCRWVRSLRVVRWPSLWSKMRARPRWRGFFRRRQSCRGMDTPSNSGSRRGLPRSKFAKCDQFQRIFCLGCRSREPWSFRFAVTVAIMGHLRSTSWDSRGRTCSSLSKLFKSSRNVSRSCALRQPLCATACPRCSWLPCDASRLAPPWTSRLCRFGPALVQQLKLCQLGSSVVQEGAFRETSNEGTERCLGVVPCLNVNL